MWLIDPIDEQSEAIQQLAARWAEGNAVLPAPRDATPPALRARIDELLLDGHQDSAVAEQLNTEGWRASTETPFDTQAIRKIRHRCGLQTLWSRLREAGKLTSPEMAVRLGIGLGTIGNWAKAGQLRGQRCGLDHRARWVFEPIDKQPEPIRKRAAARSSVGGRRGVLSDAAAGVMQDAVASSVEDPR